MMVGVFLYPVYFTSDSFKNTPDVTISFIIPSISIVIAVCFSIMITRYLKKNYTLVNNYCNVIEFCIYITNLTIIIVFLNIYNKEIYEQDTMRNDIELEIDKSAEFSEDNFEPVE